jgi:hypothetical protein
MSAAESPGAVPIAKLAELDSATHHLRDQADRDRRSNASRFRDMREAIDRIEASTQSNALAVAGLVGGVRALKWMAGIALGLIPVAVGAAWALGRIIR